MGPVLVKEERGVAIITLNRPHRGNAWTGHMEAEFRAAVAGAERSQSVGAIVVTGAGRQFCVGADSKALEMSSSAGSYQSGIESPPTEPGDPADPAHGTRFGFLRALDKPVIAAVNGSAAGVGFVLLCCADVRFVAKTAKLTAAAPRLGLPAECGISWLLPRLIGGSRATEILLSSRIVGGDEAEGIGLAHRCLEAEEVLPAAVQYAQDMVENCAPSSLRATKRQLSADAERSLAHSDSESDQRLRAMMGGEDFQEGVQALVEKRPPRFGKGTT